MMSRETLIRGESGSKPRNTRNSGYSDIFADIVVRDFAWESIMNRFATVKSEIWRVI